MRLADLLPQTKPLDRIKRMNEVWNGKYITVGEAHESLYIFLHTATEGMKIAMYAPSFDELTCTDWDFMK